jgi:hypothetical protein
MQRTEVRRLQLQHTHTNTRACACVLSPDLNKQHIE